MSQGIKCPSIYGDGGLLFSKWFIILIAKEYLPSLKLFNVLVCIGIVSGYLGIYTSYLTALGKIKILITLFMIKIVVLFFVSYFILLGMK